MRQLSTAGVARWAAAPSAGLRTHACRSLRHTCCPSVGLRMVVCRNPRYTPCPVVRQVEARDLTGRVLSGKYEFGMEDLRATLHRSAGVQHLGGTLLALPFVHAPLASIK